jgi:hypothetical protein
MVVAGVIHLLLLRTHLALERNIYGVTAAVLGVVGIVAYFTNSVIAPRRSTWALLLAITCGLMVCVVIYDAAILRYIHKTHYEIGNFRRAYQTKHAPLYGVAERPLMPDLLWPIAGTAAALGALLAARRRLAEGRISAWWFVLLQLVLTITFALSDGVGWLKPFVEHHVAEPATVSTPTGPPLHLREMLHDYVQLMPEQEGRLQHYPPGFNWYRDHILPALHLRDWQHHLIILLVCLTPLPLAGIARELGMNDAARTLALLLFSTAIGVLVYTRADFSVPAVPLSAICLWLLLRGARTGEWWAGILLGAAFSAFMIYAFTAVIMGVLMALIVAAGLWVRSLNFRNTALTVGVAAAICIAFFVGLYVWSGFNIYECLQKGRGGEAAKFGSSFDDPARYAFRSTGHVLA